MQMSRIYFQGNKNLNLGQYLQAGNTVQDKIKSLKFFMTIWSISLTFFSP